MEIFVINLEKDKVRRRGIELQAEKLKLNFKFVDGVFGKLLTQEELAENYNDKKANYHQCRSLVSAEIGCSLSHINIYRQIIENSIAVSCILEDDVILPEEFETVIFEISKVINYEIPQVILLSPADFSKNSSIVLNEKYCLKKYKSGFYTSSYIINQLAAQVLLKVLFPVSDVADCWRRLNRHKVAEIMVIVPALVTQDQVTFGSSTTIDIKENNKYSLGKKFKFKLCRAYHLFVDYFTAKYNRNFNPYAGILKEKK